MLEKNNIKNLMEIIFDNPTKEFHIRELARKIGIAAPTVLLAVEVLKKYDFVSVYRKGNMKMVRASGSIAFIRAKRVRNIQRVYESGIIDYLNDLYEKPRAIVLFGSFSRGDDIEKSDIDIAVVTKSSKEPNLEAFRKKLGRNVSIHEIDINKVSKEFHNNIVNGIVMGGAI